MSRAIWVGLLAVAIPAAGWTSKGSASHIEVVFSETASFVGAFFAKDISRLGFAAGRTAVAARATGGTPTSANRGAIFNGTFNGPAKATLVTVANGTNNYTLQRTKSDRVTTSTLRPTINPNKPFFNTSALLSGSNSNLLAPEPGTLGLLGSGLIGIAGLVRLKMNRKQ
jgi:hypothetical protein